MNFDDFLNACKDGDLARVQEDLPHANLRQADSDGNTALMLAARFGHVEVAKLLIPGSNLGQAASYGHTALMLAAFNGHVDVAKALIPGSDLRQADKQGCYTALMWAAREGHTEMVKLLIPGSDLSQVDCHKKTALMHGAYFGHVEVVKILVPGSDLRQLDGQGWNACESAIDAREWACVDVLALHDRQREELGWPEAARPEYLPQWFARRERQALECEIAPKERSVAPPTKPRHRL